MASDRQGDAVTVLLQGGLGNQMFEYAAGRALAVKLGLPLHLDLAWFRDVHNKPDVTKREYALSAFDLHAQLIESKAASRFAEGMRRTLAGRGLGSLFRERGPGFDPRFERIASPVRLEGYFQSERYFLNISDEIRKTFALRGTISAESRRYLNRIRSSPSVAVHLRRGDYVSNSSAAAFHGTCDLDYYERAAALLEDEFGALTFMVFSDDPEWCADHVRLGSATEIVLAGNEDHPHEDLWLMSACTHFIIANSSFSWWGAWLGADEQKRVVAPARWYSASAQVTSHPAPVGWTLV